MAYLALKVGAKEVSIIQSAEPDKRMWLRNRIPAYVKPSELAAFNDAPQYREWDYQRTYFNDIVRGASGIHILTHLVC